jgi:hypothetical protein
MVYVYDKKTGSLLGQISAEQLQFLIDQLEEESLEDRDYAITHMELDYFQSQGASSELISLLNKALGDQDEIIVQWSRQPR